MEMKCGATSISPNSRILIVEYNNWSPFLETGLDLGLQLAEGGHYVKWLFIGDKLKRPEGYCATSRRAPWFKLRPEPQLFASSRASDYAEVRQVAFQVVEQPPQIGISDLPAMPHSMSDLLALRYKGESMGLGVASAAVTLLVDSEPDLTNNRELIEDLMWDFAYAYECTSAQLATEEYDYAIVFNGRMPASRGAQCAARHASVTPLFFERGANKDSFYFSDSMPHDFDGGRSAIESLWGQAVLTAPLQSKQLAAEHFEAIRAGKAFNWRSFTNHQSARRATALLERHGCNDYVVFFTSSEDELVAIREPSESGQWPSSQFDALRAAALAVEAQGFRFLIRIHPNMTEKASTEVLRWKKFLSEPEFRNTVVIPPKDRASSYTLLDRSTAVITAGSTIGAEATYFGKPSILLGDSIYASFLKPKARPRSQFELQKALEDPYSLTDRDAILPFGLWLSTYGWRHRHYVPETIFRGRFLGARINRNGIGTRISQKTRRFLGLSETWQLRSESRLSRRVRLGARW